MDNETNSLFTTMRNFGDHHAHSVDVAGRAWSAWANLLDDVLDKMPNQCFPQEMDECGDKSYADTGVEHIDIEAMRLQLNTMRANADAIAAAYHRTGQKITARTKTRIAELTEDFAAAAEAEEIPA
jgi:hypothetical protein